MTQFWKRGIALLLVFVSMFGLCACGAEQKDNSGNTPTGNGVAWYDNIEDGTQDTTHTTEEEDVVIPDAVEHTTENGTKYLELGVMESRRGFANEIGFGAVMPIIEISAYMIDSENNHSKTIDNKDGTYTMIYQYDEDSDKVDLTVEKENVKLAMITAGNGVCGVVIYEENGSYYADVYRYLDNEWLEWSMGQKFGIILGVAKENYGSINPANEHNIIVKNIVRHSIDEDLDGYLLTFYDENNTAYLLDEGGCATFSEEGYFFMSSLSKQDKVKENAEKVYCNSFCTTTEGLIRTDYANHPIKLPANYTTSDIKLIEYAFNGPTNTVMVIMNDGSVYTASMAENNDFSHWVFHTELTKLSKAENFVAIAETATTSISDDYTSYFFVETESGTEYWIDGIY